MRRGRYTNDPMIIAQQDNMVSINAALQIDPDWSGGSRGHCPTFSGLEPVVPRTMPMVLITPRVAVQLCQISTAKKGTVSRIAPILDPGSMFLFPGT